ncbi:MAG: cytochrome c peroxidase [Planctomycetota bacterium]
MVLGRTKRALAAPAGALVLLAAAQSGEETPPLPEDTLPTPFVRAAPLGVEELEAGFLASNEEFELGRRLFFDPILSIDKTVSCASCHRPEFGFADDRAHSLGVNGHVTPRNSPSLLNKGVSENVLWDGRAPTLEDQVLMPIENPREMALGFDNAVARLTADPEYLAAFRSIYGWDPEPAGLALALAAFVRGLTAGDSPVDRFRDGDVEALTAEEEAGLWVFEGKGRCWRCHSGPNFSDESFHNTGVGSTEGIPEAGRFAITGVDADQGRFRTPGLRMLTKTAPYMHDGSLATLEDVVEFYREGGHPNSHLSDRIEPLRMSDDDAAHLVAFLEALSR